jgi:hypothetical protein
LSGDGLSVARTLSGDIGGKFARKGRRALPQTSEGRVAVLVGGVLQLLVVGVEIRSGGKLLLGWIPRLRSFSA